MAHAQQQILDKVLAILQGETEQARDRVFLDRYDPLADGELDPGAIVILEEKVGESVERFTITSVDKRILPFEVHCVLRGTPAEVREFALAVEKVVAGSTELRKLCSQGLQLTHSTLIVNGAGKDMKSSRVLSWEASYSVRAKTPDVIV